MSLYKYLLLEGVSEAKQKRLQEILDDYFVKSFIVPTEMYKRFERENNTEAKERMINVYLGHINSEKIVNNMIEIDPSGKGTYLNWIVRHYIIPIIKNYDMNDWNEWNSITKIKEKIEEDLYKVEEYLELFHENKADLKRRDQHTDINQYKSPQELFQVVRPYRSGKKQEEPLDLPDLIDNRYYIEHGEADLIAEDERHLVIVPKTKEASKFYACNTEWCTAYPKEFESYNEDGTLFIFIYKRSIAKYDSDNMPHDVLVQIHVPYTGEDIEARDSADDWYDDWEKDLRSYEKEIVTYLKNETDHEYNLLDTDGKDKIPMDGGTYHLEKIGGKWYVTFDDWSDMYHYVKGEEEFAKKLFDGDGFELFYSGFLPEIHDFSGYIDLEESGMKVLKEEINKVIDYYSNNEEIKREVEDINSLRDYDEFLENEFVDEDDFEEITDALKRAMQVAQEQADYNEAYEAVTDYILERLGANPNKPNHQSNRLAFETNYNIESKTNELESVINMNNELVEESEERYRHPINGYEGDVTDELYTETFLSRVDIDLN